MTIGDILAVIAAILAVATGWGATILLASLFFPARITRAQTVLAEAPKRTAARGVGITVVWSIVALMFTSHPGPSQLLGGVLWAALAVVAAFGSGGIVRILGERIQGVGTHMAAFHSLTRGVTLYISSGLLPIVGWFLVTPVALVLSVGAGWTALRSPRMVASSVSEPVMAGFAMPSNDTIQTCG